MSARCVPLRVPVEIALPPTSEFDLKHQFSLPDPSVADPDRPPTTFPLAPQRWAALLSSLCSLCNRQGHLCWAARTWDQPCIRRAEKQQGNTHGTKATATPFFF